MKKNMSSLEVHYLLKELSFLIDQKIDKIYHPEKDELIIRFHVAGVGKAVLKIMAGNFLYLTKSVEDQKDPSGFCMFLRKYLANARLRQINQLESERIVEFVFEKADYKKRLIVELFSQGNILLTDEKYVILTAIEYHKWKDREIRPKLIYEYPKKPVNFFNLDNLNMLKSSDKATIVKALAIDLGLGGTYAEEICLMSKTDKNLNPHEVKDLNNLVDAINKIQKFKIDAKIIFKNEEMVDVVPFNMKIYDNMHKVDMPSFSEGLDEFLSSKREVEKSPKQKQIEKIQRIILSQERKIEELKEKQVNESKKAEIIYSNYKLIEDIFLQIKVATKKYSWTEIKDKLKGHKVIKELNIKDKVIKLELD
ncbi:MAG: NFACT family protein [Nanoarchaeota archaeon]